MRRHCCCAYPCRVSVLWVVTIAVTALALGVVIGRAARGPASNEAAGDELRVLRTVLDVIPDGAAIVDAADRVTASSSNWATLGLLHAGRIAPAELRELHRAALKSQEPGAVEITVSPGGSRIAQWEGRFQVSPLDSQTTLVIAQDLSEERRLSDVRRDFVANVSHELKTPVAALLLLAEGVKAAGDDHDQASHFADRMQVEVRRLNEMVSDLVELSRVQGEAHTRASGPVAVADFVAEAVDAMRVSAGQRAITVNVAAIDPDLTVFGDKSQLATAMRNLVSNAINYSPPKTSVGIGVRATEDTVALSVTDQGAGISPADQSRIFERFYRVDPARSRETGGTGLGLAIVKHVCANHGGDVAVWSRLGEGSTFTLTLPRHHESRTEGSP